MAIPCDAMVYRRFVTLLDDILSKKCPARVSTYHLLRNPHWYKTPESIQNQTHQQPFYTLMWKTEASGCAETGCIINLYHNGVIKKILWSSRGCATPRKSYSNPLLGANFGSKPYFHGLSDTQGNRQIFYFHSFWLPYFFVFRYDPRTTPNRF